MRESYPVLAGATAVKKASVPAGRRGSEVVEVALDRGLALVGDRADANFGWRPGQRAGHLLGKEFGEPLAVATEPVQRHQFVLAHFEARDALEDVRRPARLAEFAVVDDVEADGHLLADDIGHRLTQHAVVRRSVISLQQRRGPRQTARYALLEFDRCSVSLLHFSAPEVRPTAKSLH